MLELKRYTNMNGFKNIALPILEREEYKNAVALSVLHKYTDETMNDNIFFATINENTNIVAVIVYTMPFNMLLYITNYKFEDEIYLCILDNAVRLNWRLSGITIGGKDAIKFAKLYADKFNVRIEVDDEITCYKLTDFKKRIRPKGGMRLTTEDDKFFVPYWLKEFFIEANSNEHRQNLLTQIEEFQAGKLYVWQDGNGMPVALAGIGKVTNTLAKIGPVYVPPHFRRKGYATAIMTSLCELGLKNYGNVMLYTDGNYVPSNACYIKIGFKKIFEQIQYKFV
jgi:RimJ/RimL family protein N-acetyltransferase